MSTKKYFKFDEINHYLENEADINYFAINQVKRIAMNNMLGDYDENGVYVINPKLLKQLIAMPKIVMESVDGAELIRGAVAIGNFFHFMLIVEESKASLILLEKINFEGNIRYNAGSYSNVNETVIDEIKIPDKDVDKNVLYNRYNIKRGDEGKTYDINDFTDEEAEAFSEIVEKVKYNLLSQNSLFENESAVEAIEADYFDNVLRVFDKYPNAKAEFEKILKTMILEKENFIKINKPFFQKSINEILENCLSVFLIKLPPELRAELEEKIRQAKEKYFYDYNVLLHFSYMQNWRSELSKKVLKIEIAGEKLNESYNDVLTKNRDLRKTLTNDNATKESIVEDNSVLKRFFGDIKKETGKDLLEDKANNVGQKPVEIKKAETKKPDAKKADVKKAEVKKASASKPATKSASKGGAKSGGGSASAKKTAGATKSSSGGIINNMVLSSSRNLFVGGGGSSQSTDFSARDVKAEVKSNDRTSTNMSNLPLDFLTTLDDGFNHRL